MKPKKNRTRKIFKAFAITFLCLLIIIPLAMWYLWHDAENKPIKIFILDKTVLNKTYQEHLSLNWVLNHNKYVKPNGEFYLPEKDYYGFFPDGEGSYTVSDIEELTPNELTALADRYDMAYYTDLYGIYWVEWHNEYPHIKPEQEPGRIGERSSLIYGGLTSNELELLKQMKERKKLIINEFNIIASPTSSAMRKKYEKEFHLEWSDWVGRYFDNLDTAVNKELPPWLVNNYMKQNNNEWNFKNSGIAFVKNEHIVILENKTHLNVEVPFIYTEAEFVDYYGVADKMKYPFWFDIIETDTLNEIVSNYKIEPNKKGDSILQEWKIPKEFPAVIRSTGEYPFYYFAGDFADNPVSLRAAKFKHINNFGFLFYESAMNERKSFFWEFYQPLLKKILEDYYLYKK